MTVTARRREEAIQDVPLAVSVLTANTIEQTGTINVGRISQLQPSVQFYSSNPRNSSVNIRGLGTPFGLTNDGIEPGVGIYIDQVYYNRNATATFDFLDVERVEILRGPQGTLYGKNTTAGAVNITSRKPTFTPEARVEVTRGNYDYTQSKASVSGPLIGDTLAGRLSASYTSREGTIYNIATGQHINELDNKGVKGQLLWQASQDFKITFSGDYTEQNPIGYGQVWARTGFDAAAAQSSSTPRSRSRPATISRRASIRSIASTDLDSPLTAIQQFGGASALAEWNLGSGQLTSVSAYRKWDWGPSNDRDFIGLPITTISANPSKQRQYSQELRYADSGDKIDYVVGVYGFYQTVDTAGVQEQGPSREPLVAQRRERQQSRHPRMACARKTTSA